MKKSEFVFIPETVFNKEESAETAEFLASPVAAGLAHAAGAEIVTNALHLLEVMESAIEGNKPTPSSQQITVLRAMQSQQRVVSPAGAGSLAGVWVPRAMAEDMGLCPSPSPASPLMYSGDVDKGDIMENLRRFRQEQSQKINKRDFKR